MPRNILPEAFTAQQSLLTSIVTKHNADGTSSVLTPFLTQEKIDLPKAVTAGTDAATHEQSRLLFTSTSETQRRLRDNIFTPVFSSLQAWVQFLKKLYRSNTKELTQWGITITDSGKITYPAAFEDRARLYKTFTNKHSSYAAGTSPLQPFITANEVDMAKLTTAVTKATDAHQLYDDNAAKATIETSLRDGLWEPVFKNIKAIGAYLIGLYSSNPKKATAWGFNIVDSVSKHQLRTTTLKPGEQKTSAAVIIGSTFTNTGTVPLHVYKGKTTTGTPAIIAAGEKMGILKGFSVITVVNPSTLEGGKFTVTVSR